MKLTRIQLRNIIQESVNESKFGDKVKSGVSKLVQDIKGLKDIDQDSKETSNKDDLGQAQTSFSNEDEAIKMLKKKYPVPDGKEQKIYSRLVPFGGDRHFIEMAMKEDAEDQGFLRIHHKYRHTFKINGDMFLFLVFEKDKVETGRVLAYFQDGKDYVLGNNGKMLFKDKYGKRVTIQFRAEGVKGLEPYVRIQGSANDFRRLKNVQTISGLSPDIPGFGDKRPSTLERDEARDFLISKFKELGGKPADSLNESLSRGSLYRRRYHGRY